jgi:hypothetical protein
LLSPADAAPTVERGVVCFAVTPVGAGRAVGLPSAEQAAAAANATRASETWAIRLGVFTVNSSYMYF